MQYGASLTSSINNIESFVLISYFVERDEQIIDKFPPTNLPLNEDKLYVDIFGFRSNKSYEKFLVLQIEVFKKYFL